MDTCYPCIFPNAFRLLNDVFFLGMIDQGWARQLQDRELQRAEACGLQHHWAERQCWWREACHNSTCRVMIKALIRAHGGDDNSDAVYHQRHSSWCQLHMKIIHMKSYKCLLSESDLCAFRDTFIFADYLSCAHVEWMKHAWQPCKAATRRAHCIHNICAQSSPCLQNVHTSLIWSSRLHSSPWNQDSSSKLTDCWFSGSLATKSRLIWFKCLEVCTLLWQRPVTLLQCCMVMSCCG